MPSPGIIVIFFNTIEQFTAYCKILIDGINRIACEIAAVFENNIG